MSRIFNDEEHVSLYNMNEINLYETCSNAEYYAECNTEEDQKSFSDELKMEKAHLNYELREIERLGLSAVTYVLLGIEELTWRMEDNNG